MQKNYYNEYKFSKIIYFLLHMEESLFLTSKQIRFFILNSMTNFQIFLMFPFENYRGRRQ